MRIFDISVTKYVKCVPPWSKLRSRLTSVAEWIRRFTRKRMVKNRGSSPVWGEKSSSSFSSQKSKTYPRRTGSTNAIRFTHQDGRVVKALDLSSNGRMSAWVRSPLLVYRFSQKRSRHISANRHGIVIPLTYHHRGRVDKAFY